ncbi:MAG: hypothetical protein ACI87W_002014 [Halieaceae bacterium]|jgi:hypothetical protein
MADISLLDSHRQDVDQRNARDQRRGDFVNTSSNTEARRHGFSARLNLLCGLAGERDFNNGRLEDITALDPDWQGAAVVNWLSADIPPALADLSALVRFLVSRLPSPTEPAAWEAYILYGEDIAPSPLQGILDQPDKHLLTLASRTIFLITREHKIDPNSYDGEQVLRQAIDCLKDLNITSADHELQKAHRLMLAASLFPDRLTPG